MILFTPLMAEQKPLYFNIEKDIKVDLVIMKYEQAQREQARLNREFAELKYKLDSLDRLK